jgi:hypothetical protein
MEHAMTLRYADRLRNLWRRRLTNSTMARAGSRFRIQPLGAQTHRRRRHSFGKDEYLRLRNGLDDRLQHRGLIGLSEQGMKHATEETCV